MQKNRDFQLLVLSLERCCLSGAESQIESIIIGDALEIIDQTTGSFDIIYNDIDKDGYPQAFRKAIPRLHPGGLFITDNMLWLGRVVTDDDYPTTLGVKPLTRLLYNSTEVCTTIIPLPDGISVAVKNG